MGGARLPRTTREHLAITRKATTGPAGGVVLFLFYDAPYLFWFMSWASSPPRDGRWVSKMEHAEPAPGLARNIATWNCCWVRGWGGVGAWQACKRMSSQLGVTTGSRRRSTRCVTAPPTLQTWNVAKLHYGASALAKHLVLF